MTEDELYFAVDAVRSEVYQAKEKLKEAEVWIKNQTQTIDRNLSIEKSLRDALNHLLSSPVVSLPEYQSLISGKTTTKTHLEDVQKKHRASLKIRNQMLLDIPKLEGQLADLELRLEKYVAPRVVLEFKRK